LCANDIEFTALDPRRIRRRYVRMSHGSETRVLRRCISRHETSEQFARKTAEPNVPTRRNGNRISLRLSSRFCERNGNSRCSRISRARLRRSTTALHSDRLRRWVLAQRFGAGFAQVPRDENRVQRSGLRGNNTNGASGLGQRSQPSGARRNHLPYDAI
jgi:hypothetical protein